MLSALGRPSSIDMMGSSGGACGGSTRAHPCCDISCQSKLAAPIWNAKKRYRYGASGDCLTIGSRRGVPQHPHELGGRKHRAKVQREFVSQCTHKILCAGRLMFEVSRCHA